MIALLAIGKFVGEFNDELFASFNLPDLFEPRSRLPPNEVGDSCYPVEALQPLNVVGDVRAIANSVLNGPIFKDITFAFRFSPHWPRHHCKHKRTNRQNPHHSTPSIKSPSNHRSEHFPCHHANSKEGGHDFIHRMYPAHSGTHCTAGYGRSVSSRCALKFAAGGFHTALVQRDRGQRRLWSPHENTPERQEWRNFPRLERGGGIFVKESEMPVKREKVIERLKSGETLIHVLPKGDTATDEEIQYLSGGQGHKGHIPPSEDQNDLPSASACSRARSLRNGGGPMSELDLGRFKVQCSPDGRQIALKMDATALDALYQVALRSVPSNRDTAHVFGQRRDTVLGTLQAAKLQMQRGQG